MLAGPSGISFNSLNHLMDEPNTEKEKTLNNLENNDNYTWVNPEKNAESFKM